MLFRSKTIRVWDVYGRSTAVEPFRLNADALALAFRPDGQEVVVSTLDGQIIFWDLRAAVQRTLIEGRKDVSGGRKAEDRMTAANNSSGKSFNSLSYTADGACVLAGGNSKHVCLYDARDGVLLRRFEISQNLSLDGTQEFLDSRKLTEAGPMELIDDRGDESDLEDRIDRTLPGARAGDMSKRKYRPEARTKCVRFSPTGRSWAAASTEGLLIYSLDDSIAFDPFDLDVDITPETITATLAERHYLKALVMSFRLNEQPLIRSVYEAVPPRDVKLLTRQLPVKYAEALLSFIAKQMEASPHVEFHLVWISALFNAHGRHLRERSGDHAATFRALQKGLTDFQENIVRLWVAALFTLVACADFLCPDATTTRSLCGITSTSWRVRRWRREGPRRWRRTCSAWFRPEVLYCTTSAIVESRIQLSSVRRVVAGACSTGPPSPQAFQSGPLMVRCHSESILSNATCTDSESYRSPSERAGTHWIPIDCSQNVSQHSGPRILLSTCSFSVSTPTSPASR